MTGSLFACQPPWSLQRPAPHVADRLMACVGPCYWGEPCDEAREGAQPEESWQKSAGQCAGLGPRFINSRPPRFVAYHLVPRLWSVCVSCIARSLPPASFSSPFHYRLAYLQSTAALPHTLISPATSSLRPSVLVEGLHSRPTPLSIPST